MKIVWFKRDLRIHDHQALRYALEAGQSIGLFIFEPEWFKSAEFSLDHLKFACESVEELRADLGSIGVPLLIRHGSAVSVFQDLHSQMAVTEVFSHEETGLDWTYKRDLALNEWFKNQSISWREFRQFGVTRALKNRDSWTKKRSLIIERPLVGVEQVSKPRCQSLSQSSIHYELGSVPFDRLRSGLTKPLAQKGGRTEAIKLLDSFFEHRGRNYLKSISSPLLAYEGCSRLSPHIAWGTVSITEIHHRIQHKKKSLDSRGLDFHWNRSLEQFESRLWSHCHFVQKMESEPNIEFENFNRKFDGMRESEFDETKFQAWCKGETGFPMIDACMRALHQHGWINFRMRAMLMSFAAYQLWLHWKKPATYLATQFVDFEPGIHYSQVQMQSGVTGINTIRIYSPRKQFQDQDPDGHFVRKYLPELATVPISDLAEPHKMPPLLQLDSEFRLGRDYPAPIVDPEESYMLAKQRIFDWKKDPQVMAASRHVLEKHGSREGAFFPAQKR